MDELWIMNINNPRLAICREKHNCEYLVLQFLPTKHSKQMKKHS